MSPSARAEATAAALTQLSATTISNLRTEARNAISSQQISDWEDEIRAALTADELALQPSPQRQDELVATHLNERVEAAISLAVEGTPTLPGTVLIGTLSIYGNLYRVRLNQQFTEY